LTGDEEPFVHPVTDELDLHTFAPSEAMEVVASYIDECRRLGILEVRIVHGRGRGVRRAEVHRLLASRADVVSFHDAPPGSGGWGATIARLAPRAAE
jgi:DNA-nicking Smr family endonuclease